MLAEHAFTREEVFPSWFANAVGQFLSVMVGNFALTFAGTSVSVPAGADDKAAVIAVGGQWRWVESTVTRAHPGGAAGTYLIFATAAADDIVGTPEPYTDDTNRAFNLAIVASGATPTIVAGTVDQYRQVGTCQWDGTRITKLTQTVGAQTPVSDPNGLYPGDYKFSAQTADHGTNPMGGGSAWLLLNTIGRTVSAATYPGLYLALGSPALSGGNFTLPSPAGRVLGAAGSGGSDQNGLTITTRAAGAVTGEENHLLSAAESGNNSGGVANSTGGTGTENTAHYHAFSGSTGWDYPDHYHITGLALLTEDNNGVYFQAGGTGEAGGTGVANMWVWTNPGTGGANTRHVHDFSGTTSYEYANHAHAIVARNADNRHNTIQPTLYENLFIKT